MKGKSRSLTRFISMMVVFLLLFASSGVGQWAEVAKAAEPVWLDADTESATAIFNKVAYNGTTWLAVGNGGMIRKSSDGKTFRQNDDLLTTFYGVDYALNLWVVVGAGGAIYTSAGAMADWQPRTSSLTSNLRSVTHSDTRFVAVGDGGNIIYSDDGIEWKPKNGAPLGVHLYDVVYGNGLFVAVGASGKIFTSGNGVDWSPQTSNASVTLLGVAYADQKYIVTGASGVLLYSENGVSWSQKTVPSGMNALYDTVYANGKFWTVGLAGTVIYSEDGEVWKAEASGLATNLTHIGFSGDMFVAVGTGGKVHYKEAAPLSNNANLSDLRLNTGPLTPPFSASQTDYTASVPYAVTSVDVTPYLADSTATVTVKGAAAAHGQPTKVDGLVQGANEPIVVRVLAQDGTPKEYKITVTRNAPSSDATLKSIGLSSGTLAFNPATEDYELTVGNEVEDLTVTPVVNATGVATVTVNGTLLAAGGSFTEEDLSTTSPTPFVFVVEAENGNKKTYTLNVTREKSSDATLQRIDWNAGSIPVDSATDDYELTVGNEVEDLTIKPIVNATGVATVTVNGTALTADGSYTSENLPTTEVRTLSIVVKAENGGTKTYTLKVTREKSSDATLSDIVLSAGSLPFHSAQEDYELTVGNEVTELQITPVVHATGLATVKVNGTALPAGDSFTLGELSTTSAKTATIVVTAENNQTKQYTIKVTREKSADATLKDLKLSPGTLDFDSATEDYEVTVANEVEEVTVTPTVNATGLATVTVNGTALPAGDSFTLTELSTTSAKTVTIVVTAENGSTKTYTLKVTREKSSDATLKDLDVSAGTLDFNSATVDYEVTVPNSVVNLMVTPTVNATGVATVTVNGNAVPAGGSFTYMDLSTTDENKITIVVKAENGSTKQYTVMVIREKSGDATLKDLKVSSGTLAFDPAQENYELTVGNEVIDLTVTPTVNATGVATVTVNGTAVPAGGSYTKEKLSTTDPNPFVIVVEAENGSTKTYTLNVTREKSSDATLQRIEWNAGSIPIDSATDDYELTVGNEVEDLTIKPIVNATGVATVTVNGTALTADGSYTSENLPTTEVRTLSIVVKAENGGTKTYTLKVTREKSSDATLSDIVLSAGSLPFHSAQEDYELTVGNEVTDLKITPVVKATGVATVTVNGTELPAGSAYTAAGLLTTEVRTITIVVTAENTDTKQYTIKVTREKSADNTLKELELSGVTLDFDPATEDYDVTVPFEAVSVTVTPTVNATGLATVTINGTAVPPGDHATVDELLTTSAKTVTIVVKAENGSTKTYTLKVIREKSSDATLKDLDVSAGTLDFDPATEDYEVTVPNSVVNLTVTPTVNATGLATVTVNDTAVPAGGSFTFMGLSTTDENKITIVVKAENGDTKQYTVTVIREKSGDATLKDLEVSPGTLDFDPAADTYDVTVGNEIRSLTVTPTVNATGLATVTVNGTAVLPGDSYTFNDLVTTAVNTARIVVKAENGDTKEYTVRVTREKSKNADLSNLTIDGYALVPDFSSSTLDYTLDVEANVKSVLITPIADEGMAVLKVNGKNATSGVTASVKLTGKATKISILVTSEDGTVQKTYTLTVNRPSNGGGGGGGGGTPPDIIDGEVRVVDENGEPLSEKVTKKLGSNVSLSAAIYAADGKTQLQAGIEVEANGRFKIKRLVPGTYKMVLYPIAPNGEKLAGAEGTLTVADTGSSVLQIEMLNPFGEVRDTLTNQTINGVKVSLYWADTEQNRSKGRTPGTLVALPQLPGMMPGQNVNGQLSEGEGQYGFLMFPEGSYYLLAERDGYETYDSRLDPETGILEIGRIAVPTDFRMKALETRDHLPYILGYADRTFQPNKGITRAELATILTRLFANGEVDALNVSFGDVDSAHWASKSIAYVHSKNVMVGYPDGNFYPNRVLTRAEMAMVLAKLKQLPNAAGTTGFTDIGDHWAKDAILKAEKSGLFKGFPDGTFRPNAELTRVQAVVILNKLLGRNPQSVAGSPKWTDVAPDFWAYKDIMEASVPHKYHLADGAEVWVK